ncbi:MAG TPA: PhoH family protein [Flavobacteriales bacterium]|nr:PhoH family protein [Flavobacteriales bacterium]
MGEKTIELVDINPVDIFGVNNENIAVLKKFFPKIKIIARGNRIKVIGSVAQINRFDTKLQLLIQHYNKYSQLTKGNINRLLENGHDVDGQSSSKSEHEVLVYGPKGIVVKARTANQRLLVEGAQKNDMIFAIGPAGTGKTYTAVAIAVKALKNKEIKKIVLTRPAVEAGENLGFLPGDLKEKLDPYLQPLYDALRDMIPAVKLKTYLETAVIEIAPLAFMRGRTLDEAIILLDEAQNATVGQLKMLLTRMGKSAKIIVTGDITQIDLPKSQASGLPQVQKILKGIKGIEFIYLDEHDVVRHELVKKVIKAFSKDEK